MQMEGKIADAIEKWRAVANIAEEIDNAFAARLFLSVGYLLRENNKADRALKFCDKAIRLNPNYPLACYHRGRTKDALDQQGATVSDYEVAIVGYDEANSLKPDFAEAYSNRGEARKVLGQSGDAEVDFDKAKELDSGKDH